MLNNKILLKSIIKSTNYNMFYYKKYYVFSIVSLSIKIRVVL